MAAYWIDAIKSELGWIESPKWYFWRNTG